MIIIDRVIQVLRPVVKLVTVVNGVLQQVALWLSKESNPARIAEFLWAIITLLVVVAYMAMPFAVLVAVVALSS